MSSPSPKSTGEIWIVVPVYNEQESIRPFHEQLVGVLGSVAGDHVICYVDDGSTDDTPRILSDLAGADHRVQVIQLARNFGHQAALTAGVDHARGEAVITMDGDGQHPPELIPRLLELYNSGHELVLTQRIEERSNRSAKRLFSSLFYRLLSRLSDTEIHPGSADFRLMSSHIVETIKGMPEYHRFLRGLVAWVGFDPVIVPYSPSKRIAGRSKYSLKKMVSLAMTAIFSFSLVPLQIGLVIGLIFLILACIEVIYVLSFWVRGMQANLAPGWSSLMFVILLVGGSTIMIVSIVGLYVGYSFQELKRRPVYIVRRRYGYRVADQAI